MESGEERAQGTQRRRRDRDRSRRSSRSVEEESAEAPSSFGSTTSVGVSRPLHGRRARRRSLPRQTQGCDGCRRVPTDEEERPESRALPRACTFHGGRIGGSEPRAKSYRHPWTNPILWRELMTRAYGATAAHRQGVLHHALPAGHGAVLPARARGWRTHAVRPGHDPGRPDDPQPDPRQRPGRHRFDQRARHRRTRPAARHRAQPEGVHLRQALTGCSTIAKR